MSNPNKLKGDRAERGARDWYRQHGFPGAERTRAGYFRDAGDLHLSPGTVVQVKDHGLPRWSEWLDQLDDQAVEARAEVAWLVVKRRGRGNPGEWLAVMTVEAHAELVRRAGYGSPVDAGDERRVCRPPEWCAKEAPSVAVDGRSPVPEGLDTRDGVIA